MPWRKSDGTMSFVRELPNRSMEGPGSYRVDAEDIRLVLDGLEDVEDVAIWHTHPSGYIGPSQLDMKNRPMPDIWMLVVALTDEGPVATWF
jgi:proteasome lid subunit RPN8/RPN11